MELAGLYDKDADYDGMIPEAVMSLVEAHSKNGHSGMSHAITIDIFKKVINFKTLTPITSDPEEWMDTSCYCDGKNELWQNKRDPSYFSKDGGKTFYNIDEKEESNV